MRKIDKYISKEKLCNLVVNRAEKLFELSSEESNYLRNRLKKYDKMELQHLYHNFTSFGVDAVLECICENEKLKLSFHRVYMLHIVWYRNYTIPSIL